LRDATSGDLSPIDIFLMDALSATSQRLCGPLAPYPQGAGNTRGLRTRKTVKRKIAKDSRARVILGHDEQGRI
jgi:hypothetical protein